MDTSKLEEVIRKHEGCEQFAYKDSLGYLTIGIGRCIDRRKGKGLSLSESLLLLKNDIEDCKHELEHFAFYRALDDVRKCVLIELVFNLGIAGLLKFKHTIDAIERKDFKNAVLHLKDSKWATQVGQDRIDNICHRLEHGEYP